MDKEPAGSNATKATPFPVRSSDQQNTLSDNIKNIMLVHPQYRI